MTPRLACLILVSSLACAGTSTAPSSPVSAPEAGDEEAAATLLDSWHAAAATADEARYFEMLLPDAVFIGTDASERWDRQAFKEYARPHFEKGKAWTFRPLERHIELAPGGHIAWFDERLDSPHMGEVRGSGVLLKRNGDWRIAHYVLSVPIPNEKFEAVKQAIAQ